MQEFYLFYSQGIRQFIGIVMFKLYVSLEQILQLYIHLISRLVIVGDW
jgi:hypothetical protein